MSKEAGKMNDTILEVKDLSVTFTQYERGFSRRTIHAVEKMDLEIKSGGIQRFGKKSAGPCDHGNSSIQQ